METYQCVEIIPQILTAQLAKICRKCNNEKDINQFKRCKIWRRNECKECYNKYQKLTKAKREYTKAYEQYINTYNEEFPSLMQSLHL
jgi:hypothetical protein